MKWPLKGGSRLIEVTATAGLTVVLGVWTVINAETSAEVLRLKSHCEKSQELIRNKTRSKPVKRPFEQIAETINP